MELQDGTGFKVRLSIETHLLVLIIDKEDGKDDRPESLCDRLASTRRGVPSSTTIFYFHKAHKMLPAFTQIQT